MFKQRFYKLENKKVVAISFEEMIASKNDPFAQIKRSKIGKYTVNTVFLCIDHSHGDRVPMVFETAILGDEIDIVGRTSTYNDAIEMHKEAIRQCLVESSY
jgi:hypothetical protein